MIVIVMNYQQSIQLAKHAASAFIRECRTPFKGEKFMTPDVVMRGRVRGHGHPLFAEVSQGTGISGGYIWGVTFIDATTRKPDYDRSTCCHSLEEIEQTLEEASK